MKRDSSSWLSGLNPIVDHRPSTQLMPTFHFTLKSQLSRIFTAGFVIVFMLGILDRTLAGCDHTPTQHSILNTAGKLISVVRLYEFGEVKYYPLASEPKPCNSPSCRGDTPSDSVTGQTAIMSERMDSDCWSCSSQFDSRPANGQANPLSVVLPCSPSSEGLLRPPSC